MPILLSTLHAAFLTWHGISPPFPIINLQFPCATTFALSILILSIPNFLQRLADSQTHITCTFVSWFHISQHLHISMMRNLQRCYLHKSSTPLLQISLTMISQEAIKIFFNPKINNPIEGSFHHLLSFLTSMCF